MVSAGRKVTAANMGRLARDDGAHGQYDLDTRSTRREMRRRTLVGAAAAVGALAVARRLTAPKRMPFLAQAQRLLAEGRGDAEAARLAGRAQVRYDELYAQRSQPPNRVLRFHLERSILPGLALYQTLLEEGADRQPAIAEMERLLASVVGGLGRLMSLLGRLPQAFSVFRWVEPWVVRLGFPAEGWEMEVVQDGEECVAFNVHRCFYLDALSSYGAPELTTVFCGGDDVVFPLLGPSITWERTMTLGRADDRCDFRWCRGVPESVDTERHEQQ
jgi:hypothetical protein